MPNEGIQGDEWDAYVVLDTCIKDERGIAYGTGRSYGDGDLVVVAGVTACQGGWESHPQGEGGQVIRHWRSEGMRNAERRNGASTATRGRVLWWCGSFDPVTCSGLGLALPAVVRPVPDVVDDGGAG